MRRRLARRICIWAAYTWEGHGLAYEAVAHVYGFLGMHRRASVTWMLAADSWDRAATWLSQA